MQASQVKEMFPRIHHSIDQAVQLCQTTDQVPDNLRNCIAQLDEESEQAKEILAEESDDEKIVECIDRLEQLGDKAVTACKQADDGLDQDVQSAVLQAHDALSELKQRLH